MDETPNLELPYIAAAQAQKHVTHNEALRKLDAVVQLSTLDRDLTAPPGSPAEGARYIVGASATGAWASQDGNIAAYQDGAWTFYVPQEGWLSWVADEDVLVAWSGTAWVTAGGGGSGSFDMLGVNATADATNRLAIASGASLFDNVGNGHQHKINKNAAGDTASLLFQTGYSGRAEFGTTGDDDFHVKVSPNGSTWYEALVVDKDNGSLSAPLLLSEQSADPATPSSGTLRLYAKNDRRVYTKDSTGAVVEVGASGTTRRNRIVNGAFQISQENGNAAGTTDGYYPVDQFSVHRVTSAGTITVQQAQYPTPAGALDRIRITITTEDGSLAAGEYLYLRTRLDGPNVADFGYGTADARQGILRFMFKGPAGTYAIAILNSATNRTYIAEFTITAANTEQIIEIVIPGDTSGTWLTDEGAIGMEIRVTLACGSTFQGATGWQAGNYLGTSSVSNGMGTAADVFEFGEFGLYLDADATGIAPAWELPEHDIELYRCMHFFRSFGGNAAYERLAIQRGHAKGTTLIEYIIMLFPPMAKNVSVSYSDATHFLAYDGINLLPGEAIAIADQAKLSFTFRLTVSGATQFRPYFLTANNTTSCRLFVSARL